MEVRFLYLVGQLGAGGAERQLGYLLQGLDRQRFKPAVCVWNYAEQDIYVARLKTLGVPVYSLPRNGSRLQKLRAFRQMVQALRPEVVHSYTFFTNVAAYVGTRGSSALAIGSVRSDFLRDRSKGGLLLGGLNARWPRHQIFNSYKAREHAEGSRSPFVPAHIYVVRNGVDLQQFRPAPSPKRDGPVRIVGVGSLVSVKRWDRLVDAAAALRKQGHAFSVEILGDGPLRSVLQDRIKTVDLTGCVSLSGYVGEVARVLQAADLLVHCSEREGCPNAVLEAMACGLPVVVTRAGESPYLIEDGQTGYLVAQEDEDALIDRIARLIEQPALRRRLGEQAHTKAAEAFGMDTFVENTVAAYREMGWAPGE